MPTFYNFRENGLNYSFDDIFVPADLFRDGNLFTWGYAGSGQLGDSTTTSKSTPVTTSAGETNWKQVSAGRESSAAIKSDGTLSTWGRNVFGQLGNNTGTNRNIPGPTFAGGTNWKQVSSGGYFSAAIKTDGTLWIWGGASDVQLGTNDTTERRTPVTTFAGGTNWKQVSGGFRYCAAIKTDGTLWTWGRGIDGPLGTNDTSNRSTPVTTFAGGTNWKQVSSGGYQIAAIKTDGTLWTWGVGTSGQLGTNDTTNKSTPVTTFAGGTNWKQVSSGNSHTLALLDDGVDKQLFIFGGNTLGQLGSPTANIIPDQVEGKSTNWKQVSAGNIHTAAIKTDGTLWTWGSGSDGRLGTGDSNTKSTPVITFAGGTNWKQVSSGNAQCAAVTAGISPEYPLS